MRALTSPNRTSWLVGRQEELTLAVETLTTEQNRVQESVSRVESQSIRESLELQLGTLSLLQAWVISVLRSKNSVITACHDQKAVIKIVHSTVHLKTD